MGRSQKIGSREDGDPLRTYAHFTQLPSFSQLLVLSNVLSFSSSNGIIHLSPSGMWIGPYNIKSLAHLEGPL
jgi:hypothetical protein